MADVLIPALTAHGTILDGDLDIVSDTSGNIHKATMAAKRDYHQRGAASHRLVVASSTAPAAVKRRADYVCDGAADEAEINAALALGNVMLTDGDFNTTTPIILNYPGHSLVGAGRGFDMTGAGAGIGRGFGTRIKLVTGFTGSYAIDIQQTGATRPAGGVLLADFLIDGGNFGTTVAGIHVRSFQAVLRGLFVRKMSGHGVNWHGYSSGEIPANGWATYDSTMTDCQFDQNSLAGCYMQNGTDLVIHGCHFSANGTSGIHYDGGASTIVTSCHSYGNTLHAIHFDGAGTRSLIIGCKLQHSDQHGVHFDGSAGAGTGQTSVNLSHCDIGMSGQLTNNTYSHIKFTGTGQHGRCHVESCNFHNADAATNKAKYAIDLGGTVVELILIGNNFGSTASTGGWVTAAVNYTGTADVTSLGNIGVSEFRPQAAIPTIVAGSGAGTSPTVSLSTGTDYRGTILLTTGTGTPNTTNDQLVVTYNLPKSFTGSTVGIFGANQVSQLLQPYAVTFDNNGFTVRCAVAPAASTAYSFRYIVSD